MIAIGVYFTKKLFETVISLPHKINNLKDVRLSSSSPICREKGGTLGIFFKAIFDEYPRK